MTIIVLASSRRHFDHYRRDIYLSKHTHLVAPQTIEGLRGLQPVALIELPEWHLGKSEEFLAFVDMFKKQMRLQIKP